MTEQEWIQANAAMAGQALANPQVRADVLEQLDTDDRTRRQARRREAARRELAALELRWKVEDE